MGQVLWRQTERAIRQGLLSGYVTADETGNVLRGRLRESEQLHRRHGMMVPVEMRHDEFTTDIAENRILLTACERMLGVPGVDVESTVRLRRVLRDLREVTPIDRRDPIPAWVPTRLNARYQAALQIAELVLRASSIEHGTGGVTANGFLLDHALDLDTTPDALLADIASLAARIASPVATDPTDGFGL